MLILSRSPFARPPAPPAGRTASGLILLPSIVLAGAGTVAGGDPEHPNEPAGMTVDTDSPWNVLPLEYPTYSSEGWRWEYTAARLSLIQPGDCPRSPVNALRASFPEGFGGGSAPVNVETAVPLCDELYMHIWMRNSANWDDGGNAGTKFCFVYPNSSNPYVNWFINTSPQFGIQVEQENATGNPGMADFAAQGFSNRLDWHRQGTGPSPNGISPNGPIRDGSWQEWEIYAKSNTETNFDGLIRYWRNGELKIASDQVKWFGDNMTKRWNRVQLSPTYGGGNNPVPLDQFIDIDHWYISYRNNGIV